MKKTGLIMAMAVLATMCWVQEAGSAGEAKGGHFGLALDLSYEYRYAPTGVLLVEDGAVTSGIDLMRDYFDRTPFGRIALGYEQAEGLSIALETTFRAQWEGDWSKADNLPIVGAAGDPLKVENFFITRGVAYWRSPGLSIALGRDKVDFGGILYGSLLPSTRLPYLDNLRMRATLGSLTIDYMVATIQALESWDGMDVDPNAGTGGGVYYGWEGGVNPTVIVDAMNRFSWKVGDLTIGVTDHATMARRNNRFYLTDFFPIIARHQTAILGTNNSMVLEASWRGAEGLTIAAQAGFDDINGGILGISDTDAPTIDAYVVGADYQGAIGANALSASAEFGYTQYLWGNYDGSQITPNDVNPFMRMQYRFLADAGGLLLPLTSPYGPGALWFRASGSFGFGDSGLSAGLDFLFLRKNEAANLIDTPLDRTAESGPFVNWGELALPISYRYGPWLASVSPAVLCRAEDGDEAAWSFELTFLAAYRLRSGNARASERQPWSTY